MSNFKFLRKKEIKLFDPRNFLKSVSTRVETLVIGSELQ
jgi:hypothetical protein